ncbi:WXG100 family type VII secretion target [Listeria sp. FSL L8-0308]|uniref:WXG100 family type VII secretion target n=1 Tax=Paenibacillus TaxID=44249 RepID=UPI001EE4D525|nr:MULTISPECIES: WXG100 family type VII secretion target [Paenibacillus]
MTTIKVTPEQLITVSKKFELAQQTAMQMNSQLSQQISFMERFWEGITKEQFYYSFQTSQKNMADFVTLTDSIARELRQHANKFRLADMMEDGNLDPGCLPPPPNTCAVPVADTRNALQKSADSLTELGQDFVAANSERYEKKFDSVWSFLDYMSYGIPKGMYQGYMERAAKQNDSWNDMLNFGTFGVTGMIQGAFNPTNAWSKEHMANLIGTASLMIGSTTTKALIKPKNILEGSVKYEGAKSTNILKESEQHPTFNTETRDGKGFTGAGSKDYDTFAEAEYQSIRKLKMKDIEEVARNTSLSIDEIRTMKKHLFFGKHEVPQPGGIEFRLERFTADDEIAFAWKTAQKGELSPEQKTWFKQLAEHELTERKLMAEGQKYRTLESWNQEKGTYEGYPPGAHENAPSQPNKSFPGYEDYYFKNMFK